MDRKSSTAFKEITPYPSSVSGKPPSSVEPGKAGAKAASAGAAHGFFLESSAGGPLIKQALAKETEKALRAGSNSALPEWTEKQLPVRGARKNPGGRGQAKERGKNKGCGKTPAPPAPHLQMSGGGEGAGVNVAEDSELRALGRRCSLIRRIEELRSSRVICFLTTLRPNVAGQIAEESVRVFLDHLEALKKSVPGRNGKLDIFLCSNGGSGTVPWRLVSLFREFSSSFNVLIPYRAYSAATLLALGADEIVMHPFAEMGPIDPTVANDFNPVEHATGKRLGISVEDVKAYVRFVKSTVGITHEDELVKTIEILAQKVHPLALGNVERFLSQTRLIAGKLLGTHMDAKDRHAIDEIVENMASRLYFHGHPISRREAKEELNLKVNLDLTPEIEETMWELYKEFEIAFENLTPFDPAADIEREGVREKEYEPLHAVVESAGLSSQFWSRRRFTRASGAGGEGLKESVLWQGWRELPVKDS